MYSTMFRSTSPQLDWSFRRCQGYRVPTVINTFEQHVFLVKVFLFKLLCTFHQVPESLCVQIGMTLHDGRARKVLDCYYIVVQCSSWLGIPWPSRSLDISVCGGLSFRTKRFQQKHPVPKRDPSSTTANTWRDNTSFSFIYFRWLIFW